MCANVSTCSICLATIGVCVFRCGSFGCRTFYFRRTIMEIYRVAFLGHRYLSASDAMAIEKQIEHMARDLLLQFRMREQQCAADFRQIIERGTAIGQATVDQNKRSVVFKQKGIRFGRLLTVPDHMNTQNPVLHGKIVCKHIISPFHIKRSG